MFPFVDLVDSQGLNSRSYSILVYALSSCAPLLDLFNVFLLVVVSAVHRVFSSFKVDDDDTQKMRFMR